MIGRALYPLLCEAGYSEVCVSPRMVYVDSSKPELVEGFTRRMFTAMIEGIREQAVGAGIIEPGDFEACTVSFQWSQRGQRARRADGGGPRCGSPALDDHECRIKEYTICVA